MTESQAAIRWRQATKKSRAVSSTLRSMSKAMEETYETMVQEARECVGHGGLEGAFPEEWSAQLLFRAHDSHEGHKVVIFCPYFLRPVADDSDEMDRALRFVLMNMDDVVSKGDKYIFIYCYLGMDWSNPNVAARLRFAYDNLPDIYRENLVKFYVLNKTISFQMTLWGFRMMLSSEFWNKIEYVDGVDALCALIQPKDEGERKELKRKFPFAVHRNDAETMGNPTLGMLGMPLQQLSTEFGTDFFDRTTGKSYPRLPCAIIFLCEALEREGGETDFHPDLVEEEDQQKINEIIDQGSPLETDMPARVLWYGLKHFLTSMPSPLLSYEAMGELAKVPWAKEDTQAQKAFLVDLFKKGLPEASAFLALYIASFLHTMHGNSMQRSASAGIGDGGEVGKCLSRGADGGFHEEEALQPLTTTLLAETFAPAFLRPSFEREGMEEAQARALALVDALINHAEEPELWIGKPPSTDHFGTFESSSDSEVEAQAEAEAGLG